MADAKTPDEVLDALDDDARTMLLVLAKAPHYGVKLRGRTDRFDELGLTRPGTTGKRTPSRMARKLAELVEGHRHLRAITAAQRTLIAQSNNLPGFASCRRCGCNDLVACPSGCTWAEVDYDAQVGTCSRCAAILERQTKAARPSGITVR